MKYQGDPPGLADFMGISLGNGQLLASLMKQPRALMS